MPTGYTTNSTGTGGSWAPSMLANNPGGATGFTVGPTSKAVSSVIGQTPIQSNPGIPNATYDPSYQSSRLTEVPGRGPTVGALGWTPNGIDSAYINYPDPTNGLWQTNPGNLPTPLTGITRPGTAAGTGAPASSNPNPLYTNFMAGSTGFPAASGTGTSTSGPNPATSTTTPTSAAPRYMSGNSGLTWDQYYNSLKAQNPSASQATQSVAQLALGGNGSPPVPQTYGTGNTSAYMQAVMNGNAAQDPTMEQYTAQQFAQGRPLGNGNYQAVTPPAGWSASGQYAAPQASQGGTSAQTPPRTTPLPPPPNQSPAQQYFQQAFNNNGQFNQGQFGNQYNGPAQNALSGQGNLQGLVQLMNLLQMIRGGGIGQPQHSTDIFGRYNPFGNFGYGLGPMNQASQFGYYDPNQFMNSLYYPQNYF